MNGAESENFWNWARNITSLLQAILKELREQREQSEQDEEAFELTDLGRAVAAKLRHERESRG